MSAEQRPGGSPEERRNGSGADGLENEFRAMFAERSASVRMTTAPYEAVRRRIVTARRRRRTRIGSAGLAFAVAAVGIGVWAAVPSWHQGAVSPGSKNTGPAAPAKVLYADGHTEIPAGPLRDAAVAWLRANYSGDLSGLTAVTTFDRGIQTAATAAAHGGYVETGVAVVDAHDGAVLALSGPWDRMTPIADLMKPIAVASAFDSGHYTPDSAEPLDVKTHPLYFPRSSKYPMTYKAGDGSIANWPPEEPTTQIDDGEVSLIEAVVSGANEPLAQLELASDSGPQDLLRFAVRAGIPQDAPDLVPVPALVMGEVQATPLTMATVYATFADDGVRHDPRMVEKLTAKDGRTVWTSADRTTVVMSPKAAQEVAGVLQAALTQGPTRDGIGSAAQQGADAGAMAGAPDTEFSAWVDGIESHYAVAVDRTRMGSDGKDYVVGGEGHGGLSVGSRLAGPAWTKVAQAVRDRG